MPTRIITRNDALELVQRDYKAWERFVARREALIEGIDWQMMLTTDRRAINEAEDEIMEQGAWLWYQMEHLEKTINDPWWWWSE